jgi:hypothetical protein
MLPQLVGEKTGNAESIIHDLSEATSMRLALHTRELVVTTAT